MNNPTQSLEERFNKLGADYDKLREQRDAIFEVAKAILEQADAQRRSGDKYCTLGTAMIDKLRNIVKSEEATK